LKHSENGQRIRSAVVPRKFVPGRFTHYKSDNIDIKSATLDGKNTVHATQMVAWQRGPEEI
jgi:hypothetical protein